LAAEILFRSETSEFRFPFLSGRAPITLHIDSQTLRRYSRWLDSHMYYGVIRIDL
jgi:hypothetical protein